MSQSLIGNLLVASSMVHDPVLSKAVCLVVHQDNDGFIGVMLNRPIQPNGDALIQMLGQGGKNHGSKHHSGSKPLPPANPLVGRIESYGEPDFDDTDFDDLDQMYGEADDLLDFEDDEMAMIEQSPAEQALVDATTSLGTVHFGGPLNGPVVAIHGSSQFAEAETASGIYVAAQKPNLEAIVQQQDGPYRLIVGHLGWDANQLQAELDAGYWHVVPATTDVVFSHDVEMWPRLIRRATAASVASWIGTPDVPMAYELN